MPRPSNYSDVNKDFDTICFDDIYIRYNKYVLAIIRRYLNVKFDTEESKDISQEVWIKVCSKLESFDPVRGNIATWLKVIAISTTIDSLRKTQKQRNRIIYLDNGIHEVERQIDIIDKENSPLDYVLIKEEIHRIRRIISEQNPETQQIIHLRFFHGLSYSQIAEKGYSHSKIGSILHRFLKKV